MAVPLRIAHQYDAALAATIAPRLPAGTDFVALGENAGGWAVPADAGVLLISQNNKLVGVEPDMPKPAGWPFNLKWVHLRSTGIDRYPSWIYEVPLVTVTRGGYAIPIAEYVLAAMLGFAKRMPQIWVHERSQWRGHALDGLNGKTLGIVGYGEIGKAIAARALAFGMSVQGTRRGGGGSDRPDVAILPLEQVLAEADHLVICTPLTANTRGMIDGAALARMKRGAHIVNIARGAVIDTEALRVALDGWLGGASLDVSDPEPPPDGHWLYTHDKVRLSPHISGGSSATERHVSDYFLANLDRFTRGETLLGVVDRQSGY